MAHKRIAMFMQTHAHNQKLKIKCQILFSFIAEEITI